MMHHRRLWRIATCWAAGEPDAGCPGAQDPLRSSLQPLGPASPLRTSSVQGKRRCQEFGAAVSGGAAVLVDEPAEHIDALDRACRWRELVGHRGDLETEPTVRAGAVVVVNVG